MKKKFLLRKKYHTSRIIKVSDIFNYNWFAETPDGFPSHVLPKEQNILQHI